MAEVQEHVHTRVQNAPQADRETRHLLYVENSKMLHTFFDWRHKVMSRFFIAISAVLFAAHTLAGSEWWLASAALLLVGAGVGAAAALMDNVNQRILQDCYVVGEGLERDMGSGVFSKMHGTFASGSPSRTALSYRVLLQVLYWTTSALLVASAVGVVWWNWSEVVG